MWRQTTMTFVITLSFAVAASAGAQGRGPMGMGMMMGMGHDSATMAQMRVIHELVANNDRIDRTVTNLPNGIRTVTTSVDSGVARLLIDHVRTMADRVGRGDDPGLPMESEALRALFVGRDKIRTVTKPTANGIIIEQTSSDSSIVAALQQHAAEVTDLVRRGMPAMHEAMMKKSMPPKAPDHP